MRSEEFNDYLYSRVFSEDEQSKKYYNLQREKIKKILDLFDDKKNPRVLDIGCGDGKISSIIAKEKGADVYGIDISASAVEVAKKRGIKAQKTDIDEKELPFKDDFFDVVVCGDVIEHIYSTETLLDNVKRILKPGGCIIVSIPNIASWYNRFFLLLGYMPTWIESSSTVYTGNPFMKEGCGHVRAFTKRSIAELLKLRGFKIEDVKGGPLMADGTRSRTIEGIWNTTEKVFAKSKSLASFVIVKGRRVNNI